MAIPAGAPIVRRVDHVVVAFDDVELPFRCFVETLGLPIAALSERDGTITSAVVNVGNANIELLRSGSHPALDACHPARIGGVVLDPPPVDQGLVAELDRRGVAHGQISSRIIEGRLPVVADTGPTSVDRFREACRKVGDATGFWVTVGREAGVESGPKWNWITVQGLGESLTVGLCEFFGAWADLEARAMSFVASAGGPLGVTTMQLVAIECADSARSIDRWQRLLDPAKPISPGHWRLGQGPELRLVEPGGSHIALGVRSVADATNFLKDRGVLDHRDGAPSISHPALGGLDLRLCSQDLAPT